MNFRKPDGPGWIAALCQLYDGALWMYPRAHRERWGGEIRLAFRDRCREAAREGHGPMRVVFADLLPDLIASVGHEHFDVSPEATPMRRTIYVLLALLLVVLAIRPYLPQAYDTAGHWWQERQEIAWQHAYSQHLQALAQATEQQRHDTRDDIAAAILYWNAAGEYEENVYQQAAGRAAEHTAVGAALRDRADAAFVRALQTGDRWALGLSAAGCPARAAVCAKDASLARLRRIDAGNGAVWLLELREAHVARDVLRERAALAQLAQATQFDTHRGDAMRAMLLAFDKLPLPSQFIFTVGNTGKNRDGWPGEDMACAFACLV